MRVVPGALLPALGALALAGCGGGGDFAAGSFGELRDGLVAGGLEICATRDPEPPPGADAARIYEVAIDCDAGEPPTVVDAVAWEDEGSRDEAVRRAESQGRRGSAVPAWTFGPLAVAVPGAPDDEASELVAQALNRLGAR